MTKRAIQATVLTGSASLGVAPGATITIKDAVTGANRTLWSDFEGTSGTGNPVTADANGQFLVYANPGRVQITVTDGVTTRIWENVELGPLDDSPNVIINGDFQVLQRSISFAAIANGSYSLDRWLYEKSGAAVHTITQDADIPTQAQADDTGGFSIKLDVTNIDASPPAAGDLVVLSQRIEGFSAKHLLNREIVLSFWVKDTVTGIHCAFFKNKATSNRSYVVEFTINASDTWEFKEITITMNDGTAGTWDWTNGTGLEVGFALFAGSTYQTAADAWQTGNFFATANQVNCVGNIANNFHLALVRLRAGNEAAPFQHRAYETELALCQRYYEELGFGATNEWFAAGFATTGTQGLTDVRYTVKRATPAITFTAANTFDILYRATFAQGSSGPTAFNRNVRSSVVRLTVANVLTAGDGVALRNNATSARIYISAEL